MNSSAYLEKITSAHITRPKFMAWLKELLDLLCEAGTVLESMNAAFSLESAVGAQLDVIGATVGAERALPYTSQYVGSGYLGDEDYRSYIRAKIMQNMWDGTNESLPGLWQAVYPDMEMSYTDNQDMSMTITIRGDVSNALSELIQAGLIVPAPMGVYQNFIIQSGVIPAAEVSVGSGLYEYGNDEFPNQAE